MYVYVCVAYCCFMLHTSHRRLVSKVCWEWCYTSVYSLLKKAASEVTKDNIGVNILRHSYCMHAASSGIINVALPPVCNAVPLTVSKDCHISTGTTATPHSCRSAPPPEAPPSVWDVVCLGVLLWSQVLFRRWGLIRRGMGRKAGCQLRVRNIWYWVCIECGCKVKVLS